MVLAARLVHAGIVPKEKAQAVLREKDALRDQLVAPSLLDLLVKHDLITRTELMIFRDRPLEEIQPFPKYVIHRKVAEGGMASVYDATYKPLDAHVALKVVKPELSRQERFLLRFRREAGLLLKLEHPHIVRGFDLAEQERVWYCAMEFAEGRDLESIVEKDGPMREEHALHVGAQMASAVAYLSARGIVHRDLKPSNVVVDPTGHCRIIDLGLCLLRGGMREDTGEGVTVGTVEYLSPEQARGRTDLDQRSDLYSIGATLHHLVAGRVPIRGETPEETLALQVLGSFNHKWLEQKGASPAFIDLVARLLEKDPDDRPKSANALLVEMRAKWPSLHPPEPEPEAEPVPAPIPLPPKPVSNPAIKVVTAKPTAAGQAPLLQKSTAAPKLVSKKDREKRSK